MGAEDIDDIDRGILHLLEEDARHYTATEIADQVGVTANTVRNRIDRLEERGVIKGYAPSIDYEQAGYQLKVTIRCTAAVPDRTELATQALEVPGVVAVRELMTGRRNVEVTVVAAESDEITEAANAIHEIGLEIEDEELVKNDHARPFGSFTLDTDGS